jgi:hypothetical protein
MTRAEIPVESAAEVEEFLQGQETGSNTLAVLERPNLPVALLKIPFRSRLRNNSNREVLRLAGAVGAASEHPKSRRLLRGLGKATRERLRLPPR